MTTMTVRESAAWYRYLAEAEQIAPDLAQFGRLGEIADTDELLDLFGVLDQWTAAVDQLDEHRGDSADLAAIVTGARSGIDQRRKLLAERLALLRYLAELARCAADQDRLMGTPATAARLLDLQQVTHRQQVALDAFAETTGPNRSPELTQMIGLDNAVLDQQRKINEAALPELLRMEQESTR